MNQAHKAVAIFLPCQLYKLKRWKPSLKKSWICQLHSWKLIILVGEKETNSCPTETIAASSTIIALHIALLHHSSTRLWRETNQIKIQKCQYLDWYHHDFFEASEGTLHPHCTLYFLGGLAAVIMPTNAVAIFTMSWLHRRTLF